MTVEQITQLLAKGYLPDKVKQYREIYKLTFNKEPQGCSCQNGQIYQTLKTHYKIK